MRGAIVCGASASLWLEILRSRSSENSFDRDLGEYTPHELPYGPIEFVPG